MATAPTGVPRRLALLEEEDVSLLRVRRQTAIGVPPLGQRVSKALEYTELSVLDQSVSKALEYTELSVLDQSVSKMVQYVLLVPPIPPYRRPRRVELEEDPPPLMVVMRRRHPMTIGTVVVLPIYPTLEAGYPWVRRLASETVRAHKAASGKETRVGLAEYPTWEWEIVYEWLPDSPGGRTENDLRTLMGLVLERRGALLPILLTEPSDCDVTDQLIGEGDGVTTEFVLVRSYGNDGYYGTEPIGRINELRSVRVGGAVTELAHYGVSTQNWYHQLLVFDTPPGVGEEIRVSMTYYFVVRLGDDDAEMSELISRTWECGSIWLRSLKT